MWHVGGMPVTCPPPVLCNDAASGGGREMFSQQRQASQPCAVRYMWLALANHGACMRMRCALAVNAHAPRNITLACGLQMTRPTISTVSSTIPHRPDDVAIAVFLPVRNAGPVVGVLHNVRHAHPHVVVVVYTMRASRVRRPSG